MAAFSRCSRKIDILKLFPEFVIFRIIMQHLGDEMRKGFCCSAIQSAGPFANTCEYQTRVDLPFSFPHLLFGARVHGFRFLLFAAEPETEVRGRCNDELIDLVRQLARFNVWSYAPLLRPGSILRFWPVATGVSSRLQPRGPQRNTCLITSSRSRRRPSPSRAWK